MAESTSTTFSLANQSLKLDSAEDLAKHVGPLEKATNYTHISLNGNTIGVPAAEALARILATQRHLQSINLADIFTGRLLAEIPAALDALLKALLQCPGLHTVDLSDNAFGLNTVAPLEAFLRAHVPLQHLILNNNGLGPTAGAAVAEALTELAGRKAAARGKGETVAALETVVCGRNRLESGSMAAWARAYGALAEGMRTVRMVQNGIRQEGIVQLIREGLARCGALRVVDLQDNTFTRSGSVALARALPAWAALEELAVGDSLLGARGFVVVAEALGGGAHKALRTLRLQYNEIDARGVAALADAVGPRAALPALQRVELNGNKFVEDDAGVLALAAALRERREHSGAESDDETWGMDELSDLEEESEDEDEDEDEASDAAEEAEAVEKKEAKDEDAAKRDKVLQQANEEENETVAQERDPDVDALADQLGKTL